MRTSWRFRTGRCKVRNQIVQNFAENLDAEVEWTVGGEEQLVSALENGDLDLVAGGISSKTPWAEQVGMTRPYTTHVDVDAKESKIVMLVPPGEMLSSSKWNAFSTGHRMP